MVWFFARGDERAKWEVRRAGARYELLLERPDGTKSTQTVNSASELLEHVGEMPRALIDEGWRPIP